MRELLQQALEALKTRWNGGRVDIDGDFHSKQTFDEAAMQSAQEAIEAALSRSKWVKVADGLPVVPEGFRKVDIWVRTITGEIQKYTFFDGDTANNFAHSITHWQHRQDDTPAPPEDL